MSELEKSKALEFMTRVFKDKKQMLIWDLLQLLAKASPDDRGYLDTSRAELVKFLRGFPYVFTVKKNVIAADIQVDTVQLYTWFRDNINRIAKYFCFNSILAIRSIKQRLEQKGSLSHECLQAHIINTLSTEVRMCVFGVGKNGMKTFLQKFDCIFQIGEDNEIYIKTGRDIKGDILDPVTDENWHVHVGHVLRCFSLRKLITLLYTRSLLCTPPGDFNNHKGITVADISTYFREKVKSDICNICLLDVNSLKSFIEEFPEVFKMTCIAKSKNNILDSPGGQQDDHLVISIIQLSDHVSNNMREQVKADTYTTLNKEIGLGHEELYDVSGHIVYLSNVFGMISIKGKGQVYFRDTTCTFERKVWWNLKIGDTLFCHAKRGPKGYRCEWKAITISLTSLQKPDKPLHTDKLSSEVVLHTSKLLRMSEQQSLKNIHISLGKSSLFASTDLPSYAQVCAILAARVDMFQIKADGHISLQTTAAKSSKLKSSVSPKYETCKDKCVECKPTVKHKKTETLTICKANVAVECIPLMVNQASETDNSDVRIHHQMTQAGPSTSVQYSQTSCMTQHKCTQTDPVQRHPMCVDAESQTCATGHIIPTMFRVI